MGSSGSKPRSANRVGDLNFSKLLQRIQEQAVEIEKLENKIKEQETEITKLKRDLKNRHPVKITTIDAKPLHFSTLSQPSNSPPKYLEPLSPYDIISDPIQSGPEVERGNLPKIGDHVVSMWGESKWQYFTATIVDFDSSTLKYTIEWDDGDPTGRVIDYYNLALDKVPSADLIGVGSKVLFHQGEYRQQEVHGVTRSGGWRWHQGIITKIDKAADDTMRYEGKHTKGHEDGKWITYKDYQPHFKEYRIEDFRMPPNKFDILDSVNTGSSAGSTTLGDENTAIDVFISFAKLNSPSAIKNNEVKQSDLPPSYAEVVIEDLCDPKDIIKKLKDMGVRVYFTEGGDDDSANLLNTVSALKRAKVFIACLSDEYANDENCRMEFQYAKKTMKIPVIPIVVGTGSFQWKMTVVGLLIAGELYIHFKDRSVEGFKMNELVRAVKKHIPELKLTNMQFTASGNANLDLVSTPGLTLTGAQLETATASVFFSYCWSNSLGAFENKQISGVVGNAWNDPRVIAQRLRESTQAVLWIDVKRLESAADGMGMFGQIATAITDCKVAVACVSNEYAASDNCRMELQFAASSLQKPIVVVIVGDGMQWTDTVVGKVAAMRGIATVNMQGLGSSEEFKNKISEITEEILKVDGMMPEEDDQSITSSLKPTMKISGKKKKIKASTRQHSLHTVDRSAFKAPMIGDHVVCLHQSWAYFMATVKEFDSTDLMYTVDWDDGDPSGRVQSYKDVALDVVPDSSQIGVGSIVIFPQGSYAGTEGSNDGGRRYHQGKITEITKDENGETRYDGVHTKGSEDGKWVSWRDYDPSFKGLRVEDLRISPNAMDALMACRLAFNLSSHLEL